MRFSMVDDRVNSVLEGKTSVILVGIETHVCIQQTALDLMRKGVNVVIPVEGVSSQRLEDRNVSLRLLLSKGATITTVESAVMTMLETADHPQFRQVMKILLNHSNTMKAMVQLE
jgi:nicotinamidase-related amidase